ncbi:deoxyribose-phosphate aldolase [Methanobrevibacter filiformis]|uniref:Deoxyribose-phosphate aldolase n=1 Tax=Methanobrevibacter filiformis TaxID=55758 RepID=A0A166CK25_9EURY|nr:deoxyribose-phosphate aldolase [Methanobrevibacter filiformis]KZX14593.1 deoxyribose-phosphate aldolase [Methanobrevibacter filiformis]
MRNFKSSEELAKVIESTNLKNNATKEDIKQLAIDAEKYNFYSVVVSPYYVNYAKELLKYSKVKVGTVIGFPLGYTTNKTKEFEVKDAINNGCDEIDMVMNIEAFKSGDIETVKEEIKNIVSISKESSLKDIYIKVIIETGILNKEEKINISNIVLDAGADFIKTSTGFNNVLGANVTDITLLRKTVPSMKIKASGGINNYKTAFRMLSSGADRLGTSNAVEIIEEFDKISAIHEL